MWYIIMITNKFNVWNGTQIEMSHVMKKFGVHDYFGCSQGLRFIYMLPRGDLQVYLQPEFTVSI